MMPKTARRLRGFLLAACAAFAFAPASVLAQGGARNRYSIQSGDLGTALTELARQSDREIHFPADLTRGRRAHRLDGDLSVEQALDRLLRGSGLRYRLNGNGAIVIERGPGEAEAGGAAAEIGSADQDIVVTGSRLRRNAQDEGPTPVTTFDRERIEELGVANVADVFNYLSQQPFSLNEGQNLAGAREVRLRGLGNGTTLVLINGRRTVTSALQATRGFFDLNTIPLPAVERVEVLSSSASAVYGADAIGGVVNIVLRRAIERPQIDLHYGSAEGGATERRASLSFGHAGSRWNAAATFDYFDRDFLFGSERDFTANGDFRSIGGLDQRSVVANPGNITSSTTANLPGLNSRIAAVPIGSTGVGLTPASFAATAGLTNRESLQANAAILPSSRRYSAAGSFDIELTDGLTLFAEAMFRRSKDSRRLSPPSLSNRSVPASNAFNPFGVPVVVNFLIVGFGANPVDSTADYYRGVAGIAARFGRWDAELSVLRTHDTGYSATGNIINAARLTAALASNNPATALNPFQDGPGGSQTLLDSLRDPDQITRNQSDALQAAFFMRGPLLDLPAGALDVVFGAEARGESVDLAVGSSGGTVSVRRQRGTEAIYGEARIPLIGPFMGVPLVRRLVATLAARHDNYSDFGGTTNPEVGVQWYLHDDLLLRGSWGKSFRPPSLWQLYAPRNTTQGNTQDPLRNNEIIPTTFFTGGNSNLEPERAESWGAGGLFTPGGPLNLRFGATWWSIRQELRILILNSPVVLVNTAVLPGRVVRQAPTPADIAAGLPGRLVSVDLSNINSGALTTSGIDFEASGRLNTGIGALTLNATATWVDSYRVADFPGQTPVERVGVANLMNTVPRWRIVSALGWNSGGANLSLTARWSSSYADASITNVLNGRRVPDQFLIDLDGSIDLGRTFRDAGIAQGLVLRAGVKNMFDNEPEYAEIGGPFGVDISQADVRQRFAYVGLSKRF